MCIKCNILLAFSCSVLAFKWSYERRREHGLLKIKAVLSFMTAWLKQRGFRSCQSVACPPGRLTHFRSFPVPLLK
jgi:hypothetical protein